MEVLRGRVVGGVLLQFTKAGQSGALCCQRCMDFWASFSRVSKSSASYLLLTGPGPASSAGQGKKVKFQILVENISFQSFWSTFEVR